MIYLDSGATSLQKPPEVAQAVARAIRECANPGRGGYEAAMAAAEEVFHCRETAGRLFDCEPQQIVFTANCTHSLNIALRSLISPNDRVAISGFEHNAVTRCLKGIGAEPVVAGCRLFDWEDTLTCWEAALRSGVKAAVFTHISNVFGYILPVYAMARLCRAYAVPFVVDAAQSAGVLSVSLKQLGADYVAMPGHKGLLGPQGTGLLLCAALPEPLLFGGTGSESENQQMPQQLPERSEAGTLNVPGIAGLAAGMAWLCRQKTGEIYRAEHQQAMACVAGLRQLGVQCFSGIHQGGTVSFVADMDSEELAQALAERQIAVRAGLHCAPLAHRSAGTLETGTVRVSYGIDASAAQTEAFLCALRKILERKR